MATAQLKVFAFDSSVSQFNITGASPWLRDQDYPAAYIDSSGRNTDQEFFTFDPPEGAVAIINSVTLYVYGWQQNAGQMAVEINSGDTGLALPTGGVANRAWASVDVSGILTTWAQIAAAQLGFDRTNNTANSGADAAYLLVDYDLIDGAQDLAAGFTVRRPASQELLAEFVIQEALSKGSENLLGEFTSRKAGSQNLLGELTVKHAASQNLSGEFISRHTGSQELLDKLTVQQPGSQELLTGFTVRRPENQELPGKFTSRQAGSQDLATNFEIRHGSSQELPAGFIIQAIQASSVNLLTQLRIRQSNFIELPGKYIARKKEAIELPAQFKVAQPGSEELLSRFTVQPHGSADLPCGFIVSNVVGSADLLGKFEVRNHVHSPQVKGIFTVNQTNASQTLPAKFRVRCSRRFGGNWQRKMWHDGAYYWRARYCPTHDRLEFEYIAEAGLAGNVWTENVAARITAVGFTGIDADFTVRGAGEGIPTTIHYSDGVDTWIAESDESSVLGWTWQNLTKVFEGTAPDYYRKVNLAANRTTPIPRLWACAVFFDQSEGKQWVKASRQSTGGDITGWDGEVPVSNPDNTDTIYGCSVRSMSDAGVAKNDMIFLYKEAIAIRSKYYDGDWDDPIEDVDTTTLAGRAAWDLEHVEMLNGDDMAHFIYVDADGSIQWRERDPGAAQAWSAPSQLEAAHVDHLGVGIIDHGSGWSWCTWVHGDVIEYRLHVCLPEFWYPLLANPALIFDPSTDAVITTSTVAQLQTPDAIHAGDAVPVCWIGQTAPGTPCGLGWGILRGAAEHDLPAGFIVRHSASVDLAAGFDGQVSLNFPAGLIVRQPASEELPAEFDSGQDWENFPAQITVRHSASRELHAGFDGQVSLNLPAEFSARRSTQQELAAEFVVNQSSRDLPGEFVSRQPGSQPLLAVMNIVHSLNLGAKFEIRHSTSENLQGAMTSRQADSQTLIAAFSVIPEASADLLGGFISRKTISSISGVVIAYNPRALFNLELDIGTGFTGGIKEGSDKVRKNIGEASMKVATRYEKDRNDYVTFGWKHRYAGEGSDQNFTATPGRNLNAGFTVPWQAFKELAASFEVGGPTVRTYVTILPFSYNPFAVNVGTDWTTILESVYYGTPQMGDAWLLNWDAMIRSWVPGVYYSARITLQHEGEAKIVLGYETSTRPPTGWVWDGLAVGILPIALTRSYLIFFGYPTTPFTIRVEMKASSGAFDVMWQYLTGTYTYTR